MPTYVYRCDEDKDGCGHQFEIFQKMSDSPKKKCPECKKWKLYKVPQLCYGFVSEPRTLGALAERNSARMGSAEVSARTEENKTKREIGMKKLPKGMRRVKEVKKPWWRKEDKPDMSLLKLSEKKKKKYIMTGEK